jgi:hypothetical protein
VHEWARGVTILRERYEQMDGAFPSFPEMSEALSKEKMYG